QADGLNGEPLRWREIAPLVWREVNGKQRLSARLENGKVTLFSYDELSPFMVFQPVSGLESTALRLTLGKLALLVLGFTMVSWPTGALIRRRYGARLALDGQAQLAYRGARTAAALVFVALAGWMWTFMGFINGSLPMTDGTDGWLRILHLFTSVVFLGAV